MGSIEESQTLNIECWMLSHIYGCSTDIQIEMWKVDSHSVTVQDPTELSKYVI